MSGVSRALDPRMLGSKREQLLVNGAKVRRCEGAKVGKFKKPPRPLGPPP